MIKATLGFFLYITVVFAWSAVKTLTSMSEIVSVDHRHETEMRMSYLYKLEKTAAQEWAVIEMNEGDPSQDERIVARCRERDDACTILNCFTALDAGDIILPERVH